MSEAIGSILLLAIAFGAVAALRQALRSRSARRRLSLRSEARRPQDDDRGLAPAVARWLRRAGFRGPGVVTRFAVAAVGFALVGLAAATAVSDLQLGRLMALWLDQSPGGFGRALIPIARLVPTLVFVLVASPPWLYVRAARRRVVQEVEADLPLYLDLLATLALAGLGLDSALSRLLESTSGERALARELRQLQNEIQGGRDRIECFWRLRDRVDVVSLTRFVSAVVTTEQLGASMVSVLRQQADEERSRRRERAMAQAQTLTVRLVFPLVTCFMPGLFVVTLGPAAHQLIDLIDSVVRTVQSP